MDDKKCPKCGEWTREDVYFCENCGHDFTTQNRVKCPRCKFYTEDFGVCENCGYEYEDSQISEYCPSCKRKLTNSCMFCEHCGYP